MGISSGSSKVTPGYGKKYIDAAAASSSAAYNANSGNIQDLTNRITGLVPSLTDRARDGTPGLNAAENYITDTLGRDPQQNPHLDSMLDITNGRVRNQTMAGLGTRGLTGGTVAQDIVSRNLANNETGLRYQDYSAEMARRAQAASMASGVSSAQNSLYDPVFNAAGAAMMPIQAANANAAGIGGLLGQYTNTKTTNPWGPAALGAAANVGAAFAMSDRRLKQDIRRVGHTDGGLPVYTYRYIDSPQVLMGVMADEVAAVQPHALGPIVEGFGSVLYGEVR